MCKNWPDFPVGVAGATGGLILNTVIICGGRDYGSRDECYSLTSEKVAFVTYMNDGRNGAASIVLNGKILWVTGGYDIIRSQLCSRYSTKNFTAEECTSKFRIH